MADNAGNAVPSWRDAYKMAVDNPLAQQQQQPLSSLAFRSLLNNSAAPIGSSAPQTNLLPKYTGPSTGDGNGNGFLADTMNNIGKAAQTPVIKQILDALSVGTYATANAADDIMSGADKVAKGDMGGFLDIASAPVRGIGQGLSAAAGNANDVKTWSDVIKHGQQEAGVDSENDAAKWIQGIGGFVGDVALDPTTYLSLGGTAVAKGLKDGFVEGSKSAAKAATTAVEEAGKVGGEVAPQIQKIADNADNAGFLNRFVNAKNEAVSNYADYKAANGGKFVNFNFPFAKGTNPKDAEAIASTNPAASVDDELSNLVPKEPAMAANVAAPAPTVPTDITKAPLALEQVPFKVGADGTATAPGRFVKTPEVAQEEAAITEGLTKASEPEPGVAPITNDPKAKAVATAEVPGKHADVLADIDHENMNDILNNVKFSRPAYEPDVLVNHKAAHDASLDQTVERDVVPKNTGTRANDAIPAPKVAQEPKVPNTKAPVSDGKPDHMATLNTLKNMPDASMVKIGRTSLSKTQALKAYINASKSPTPGAVDAFWNMLPKEIRRTGTVAEKEAPKAAPKAAPVTEAPKDEKVTETIPGTPIDFNDPKLSSIKPEHQSLSPEELKAQRKATGDATHMARYIRNDATKAELDHMAEKLGLSKSADKAEIVKAFGEKFKAHRERIKAGVEAQKVAKAEAKAAPKNAREAVGEANQATAELVDKVPLDQTLIHRANRAIQTNMAMHEPLTKIKYKVKKNGEKVEVEFKPEVLAHDRDIENLPKNAVESALKTQAAEDRPHRMDGGAKSDTANPQTGTAIYPDKWGTMSMVAMHGTTIRGISSIAKTYLAKTGERMPVLAKMELYKRTMQASMAHLRAMGIAPYLDLGRAHNATHGVNLGIDDLSDLLFKDMETHFFGGPSKHIQSQAFATGVEALIRAKMAGKTTEQVSEDIMHAFTGDRAIYRGPYKNAEGAQVNGVSPAIVGRITGISPEGKVHPFGVEAAVRAGRLDEDGKIIKTTAESRKAYLEMLKGTADRWAKSDTLYQNLNNRMIVNAKEHGAELGAMVDRVSEDTLAKIMQKANSGISMGDFMNEMEKTIKEGKAALGPEDGTKYMLWETAMNRDRAKIMKEPEQATARVAKKVAKLAEEPAKEAPKAAPTVRGTNTKVTADTSFKISREVEEKIKVENTKNVDDAEKEAKQAGEEEAAVSGEGATPETIADLYDVRSGAISLDAWRRIHPIESFFSTKFGLDGSGMSRAMGTGLHTQVRMQSIFHGGVLNYLAKNPDKLMEDWKTIQNEGLVHIKANGNSVESFVPSTDSAKELYNMVNSVFDVSKDNIMTRNGLMARHWNAVADSKGFKLKMDESKSILENSRAWMSHEGLKEPKDVLEFLSKAHAVSVNLTNDLAIASNFARTFGSAVPKEGHALLAWSKQGINKNKTIAANEKAYGFFDMLPKTLYYDKAASRDIANIHRVLNESRSIKPEGALGSFMNNVFNPVTNIMKASQTIVRPGHWVNNTLGDVMRNYLAGVSSIAPYRHSIAMMKANGKEMKAFGENPLEAYQWHKATTDGNFEVHGRGDGIVIHIGGKPQKVSYESMYRLMQDGPIMPKHHGGGVAEDFMQTPDATKLNRFGQTLEDVQNKVLDNDTFSLNNLAATRDNFSRTALAIDHAMKGKFKDIHDLKASMEEKVLSWIPTSTDFTAKEAKYVRPAFMYYTWLRGITPRIVDTMMNKPGVALIPQKALYEFAKTQGVDPTSLGNPFPPNAQMPSYYYDNVIGPLMKGEGKSLWGINFANPVTDVMDQLGAGVTAGGLLNGSSELNMGKTVLGAASPFAKIPIDLATGTSNGVPITDPAQYVQDSLTGSYGGLLSKMTGKNITGQGRTDTANGAMHGENQSNVAALQIANFLSGLKITDYNSPAAQRSYVGEQKAKFSASKADYRRNS